MTMLPSLSRELQHYQYLKQELQTAFPDADEDTLRDTLEGISTLREALTAVLRSYLDDTTLAAALRERLSDMQQRLNRIEARSEKKRVLIGSAMDRADIKKL